MDFGESYDKTLWMLAQVAPCQLVGASAYMSQGFCAITLRVLCGSHRSCLLRREPRGEITVCDRGRNEAWLCWEYTEPRDCIPDSPERLAEWQIW